MESSFSSTSIAPPSASASGVAPSVRRPVSVVNNGTIGHPHTFTSGHLSPRTIRVTLEEIQKPDLGRKYARKDKRPLDPPPVVLCRFFNITKGSDGTYVEVEMDPEQPALGGICHLDLFPVPPEYYEAAEHLQRPVQATTHVPLQPSTAPRGGPHAHIPTASASAVPHNPAAVHAMFQTPSIPSSDAMQSLQTATTPNYDTSHAVTSSMSPTLGTTLSTHPGDVHGAHVPPESTAPTGWQEDWPSNAGNAADAPEERDIVAWYGDLPIRESSKCPGMLSGGTSMQAEVIDYKGKKSAVFVFPDVAVKAEGLFFLRYRALNVLSKCAEPTPMPILAECYGGPFKIYSSKEFPGLQASTELTKNLALHGLRVNSRENPRRRRRQSTVMDEQEEEDEYDNPPSLPEEHRAQRRTVGIRPSSRGAGSSTSPTSFASPLPSATVGGTSSFAPGPSSIRSGSRPLSRTSASSAASRGDTSRQWPQHP